MMPFEFVLDIIVPIPLTLTVVYIILKLMKIIGYTRPFILFIASLLLSVSWRVTFFFFHPDSSMLSYLDQILVLSTLVLVVVGVYDLYHTLKIVLSTPFHIREIADALDRVLVAKQNLEKANVSVKIAKEELQKAETDLEKKKTALVK